MSNVNRPQLIFDRVPVCAYQLFMNAMHYYVCLWHYVYNFTWWTIFRGLQRCIFIHGLNIVTSIWNVLIWCSNENARHWNSVHSWNCLGFQPEMTFLWKRYFRDDSFTRIIFRVCDVFILDVHQGAPFCAMNRSFSAYSVSNF